jgi:hypothetical protein
MSRILICIHTTGSQQAPARKYRAIETAIQVLLNGKPARCIRYRPVAGCRMMVGVVKA